MSAFLRNCIRNAILVAFGVALLALIFGVIVVGIAGLATGPGAAVLVAAALPILLISAGIFGAMAFISMVVACVTQDNLQGAGVQAGAPGGGGQPLEEDKDPPRCTYCELLRKRMVLVGAVAGIIGGFVSLS
ncbi:MAG: hypothetical protein U1A06_15990 [Hoeflea sp.]|nr:hypothetical protein [Hoeflea sp.]